MVMNDSQVLEETEENYMKMGFFKRLFHWWMTQMILFPFSRGFVIEEGDE